MKESFDYNGLKFRAGALLCMGETYVASHKGHIVKLRTIDIELWYITVFCAYTMRNLYNSIIVNKSFATKEDAAKHYFDWLAEDGIDKLSITTENAN